MKFDMFQSIFIRLIRIEQVQVLSEPSEIMKNINFSEENRIVLAGDLNVFIVSQKRKEVNLR